MDYVISGVWKDTSGNITHVMLHTGTSASFALGEKKTEAEVIRLIRYSDATIFTMTWNYPNWVKGAQVEVFGSSLRTNPNASSKDNLTNSLPYHKLLK